MRTDNLKKALQPYEAKLQAQERFRKLIGVKEVDGPTYEKYIVGPIERFERRKNAFMTALPDNPFGREFREHHICRDITERKRAEAEREKLIHDLQKALAEVKKLSGFLPKK